MQKTDSHNAAVYTKPKPLHLAQNEQGDISPHLLSPRSLSAQLIPPGQPGQNNNHTHAASAEQAGFSYLQGLSSAEAEARLAHYGRNELGGESKWGWLAILWRQLANALTVILVAAGIVAFATKDWPEAGVIAVVILVNVVIGFVQEQKAENTMASLRELSSPVAFVVRRCTSAADTSATTPHVQSSASSTVLGGSTSSLPHVVGGGAEEMTDVDALFASAVEVNTADLVPGDLVVLRTGASVPADLRVVLALGLAADEALLTGESLPSTKSTKTLDDPGTTIPLGDRSNVLFSSTTIARGRGVGLVYATGKKTEVGKIAEMLKSGKGKKHEGWSWARIKDTAKGLLGLKGSTLQIKLAKLAIVLFIVAVVLVIVVFAVSKFKIDPQTLIYAISLSIAIIPEALPCVVVVCLSVGSKYMAVKGAIVRRLDCLETLGGVDWICSDKTGTLTLGKMSVVNVWLPGGVGQLSADEVGSSIGTHDMLAKLVQCASVCNTASVKEEEKDGQKVLSGLGDPTELALQRFAHSHGIFKPSLLTPYGDLEPITEHPFDSAVKSMSVVLRDNKTDEVLVYMKGAVEKVLAAASMKDEERGVVLAEVEVLAARGLRVLALAYKATPAKASSLDYTTALRTEVNVSLTFLGLVGIMDPPRPSSLPAVQACHAASINITMLTGDHSLTAIAIARQVGILPANEMEPLKSWMVTTGPEFDAMTDDAIDTMEDLPRVIARCSPKTKVDFVRALRRRGKISAMTGDGTNDAPSLKLADVGLAMGGGTDVAKSCAEVVIVDDEFGTVAVAIEQGRRIFANLCKFVLHLMSSNSAEVIVLVCGLAFLDYSGSPVYPLSPITILFENLITSALPSIGLSFEESAADIMMHPGRKGIFNKEFALDTLIYGLSMGLGPIFSWVIVIYAAEGGLLGNPGDDCNSSRDSGCGPAYRARSAVFVSLTLTILLHAFTCKDPRRSLFSYSMRDFTKNKFLFYSVIGGIASIPLCVHVPGLNHIILKQSGITWEWGPALGVTLLYVASAETWKCVKRRWLFVEDETNARMNAARLNGGFEKGEKMV